MIRRLLVLIVAAGVVGVAAYSHPAQAIDLFDSCKDAACSVVKENRLAPNSSNVVLNIMRVVLMALGAISVLMIVIGGLRYVLSQGDSNGVNSAKNTILYAVIGLVVALLSAGIVQFVTGQFL